MRGYGLSWRERFDWWWDKTRLCHIQGKHQEKMDSHGRCYRCNKLLESPGRGSAR